MGSGTWDPWHETSQLSHGAERLVYKLQLVTKSYVSSLQGLSRLDWEEATLQSSHVPAKLIS